MAFRTSNSASCGRVVLRRCRSQIYAALQASLVGVARDINALLAVSIPLHRTSQRIPVADHRENSPVLVGFTRDVAASSKRGTREGPPVPCRYPKQNQASRSPWGRLARTPVINDVHGTGGGRGRLQTRDGDLAARLADHNLEVPKADVAESGYTVGASRCRFFPVLRLENHNSIDWLGAAVSDANLDGTIL